MLTNLLLAVRKGRGKEWAAMFCSHVVFAPWEGVQQVDCT